VRKSALVMVIALLACAYLVAAQPAFITESSELDSWLPVIFFGLLLTVTAWCAQGQQ